MVLLLLLEKLREVGLLLPWGLAGLHVAAVMLELLLAWLQPGVFLLWPRRGCWHRAELAAHLGSFCASPHGAAPIWAFLLGASAP